MSNIKLNSVARLGLIPVLGLSLGCQPNAAAPNDAGVAPDGAAGDSAVADTGGADAGALVVPATYAFDSYFMPGTSSVGYSGQVTRYVLIRDLAEVVEGLTTAIDSGTVPPPAEGDIVAALDFLYETDAAGRAGEPIRLVTTPATLQSVYGDLSMTASVRDKLAGNDTVTDFRDFSTGLVGWSDASIAVSGGGIESPSAFVRAIFETIEANSIARGEGTMRPNPVTGEDLPVHLTTNGIHLAELLKTFLLMGVAYHQAADDYLDDEPDDVGKGLFSDNEVADGSAAYTVLEHSWDEGYGYFGASRDFASLTLADVTDGTPYGDTDGDGRIDLRSEHSFNHAVYFARRDVASAASARTDNAARASLAFRTGRALIARARGHAMTTAERDELRAQRDIILRAWEEVIAANVVHYLNGVLGSMAAFGTAEYDFESHAGDWSEMKAFAMGLQFNRHSPILDELPALCALLRDAPVLPTATATEVDAYAVDLRAARAMIGSVYGFDAANLGDDDGNGGW